MSNLNILVVEDEEAIREMLLMALSQGDLNVTAVGSAEEALRILADINVDLLVLDWVLPGISGVELARRLKNDSLYKQLPIILLTARGEEADKIRGLEIGEGFHGQFPAPYLLGNGHNPVLAIPFEQVLYTGNKGIEITVRHIREHIGQFDPVLIIAGIQEFGVFF